MTKWQAFCPGFKVLTAYYLNIYHNFVIYIIYHSYTIQARLILHYIRADSRLAPSQWETSLQSNDVSHWLSANLESALLYAVPPSDSDKLNRLLGACLSRCQLRPWVPTAHTQPPINPHEKHRYSSSQRGVRIKEYHNFTGRAQVRGGSESENIITPSTR